MAMKQRQAQIFLQRRDLTADRRLAHVQRLAGMGEAAGGGCRMENPKFVPVHSLSPANGTPLKHGTLTVPRRKVMIISAN